MNCGKKIMINGALEILDAIRTTKISLDVSSESGVHTITETTLCHDTISDREFINFQRAGHKIYVP